MGWDRDRFGWRRDLRSREDFQLMLNVFHRGGEFLQLRLDL
jgi:hypothetical protein